MILYHLSFVVSSTQKGSDIMANITKRGNSYLIRVSCGYDMNDKKISKSMTWKPSAGMTQKQIEKELQKQALTFEERVKNGLVTNNPRLTLSDFVPQYLEIMQPRLSPATYSYYKRALETQILPLLGHLRLNNIKPVHVQEFINTMSKKPIQRHKHKDGTFPEADKQISAATVRRYLTILQSVLNQAVKLEIIATNPARAEKLTIPKIVTPKVEIFTKQEAAEMLSSLEQEELQFQVLIQLAIMTGARRGELCALKFSDVDFTNKRITIERAAVKLKGQPIATKPPKDYEIRTISINDYCIELIQMLKGDKIKQAAKLGDQWQGDEWLFTQWNGTIMNPQTPTKWFSKFLERNGLKHRKFHSLRHTSATLLLYGGVDVKAVQERLGLGDIETTSKYLHCLSEADENAANVLSSMLIVHKGGQADSKSAV